MLVQQYKILALNVVFFKRKYTIRCISEKIRQLAEIPAEPGDMSDSKRRPGSHLPGMYYTVPVSQSPQNPPAPAQLSRSTMWWGTMIFVATSSGFSTWLIIWAAASIPSWQAFTSTDVRGGKVSLARRELLKDRMDTSPVWTAPDQYMPSPGPLPVCHR